MNLTVQVSRILMPVVDAGFHKSVGELRTSLYNQLGVTFARVQVTGNSLLPPGDFMIYLNDVPVVSGEEVGNTHAVLLLHLAQVTRRHVREFIGIPQVLEMIEDCRRIEPLLVEEITPKRLSMHQLTEILQRLVEEDVSIRDLGSILRILNRQASGGQDIPALVELVRADLKEDICRQIKGSRQALFVHPLDPAIEDGIRNCVRQSATGSYIAMEKATIDQIVTAAHTAFASRAVTTQRPVVVASSDIRRFVKRLLDRRFPDVAVLSHDQLASGINLQPLRVIALPATCGAA